MKHLNKFNESDDFIQEPIDGHIRPTVTWQMLLDAADELKGDEETIGYFIETIERHITRKGIDVRNNQAGYFNKPFNFLLVSEQYVVILKVGKPYEVIKCYGLMNPFEFKNIIIMPGRDYVVCYDLVTGETKRAAIR